MFACSSRPQHQKYRAQLAISCQISRNRSLFLRDFSFEKRRENHLAVVYFPGNAAINVTRDVFWKSLVKGRMP